MWSSEAVSSASLAGKIRSTPAADAAWVRRVGVVHRNPLLTYNVTRYTMRMIRSFASRETERLFHRERVKRIPPSIQRVALRKLRMLHRATSLMDLWAPPANRLEALEGDRNGQHSIRINKQFRICFRWRTGDAFGVEIVGYHP